MRRRAFIAGLGGAMVAAAPLALRAQDRVRRLGVLLPFDDSHPIGKQRLAALIGGLRNLGWIDGRNIRIDIRSTAGNAAQIRKFAEELVALDPDVIFSSGSSSTGPLLQVTRTVPIVFAFVIDPVGGGLVESLARPGGNATGFIQFEYSISGKWLELLKEIAPGVKRVAVIRDAATSGPGQFGAIQSMASAARVDVTPMNVRNASEIERAITSFGRFADGGLIQTGSSLAAAHASLIIALAARYKIPAIYSNRLFADVGGLASYGVNSVEQFGLAASYVDRILKGDKPADLPVQVPTKYELVINLKTAKALGIEIPASLLARADEVFE